MHSLDGVNVFHYRADQSAVALPLYVVSVGHLQRPSGTGSQFIAKRSWNLLWTVSGEGLLRVGDTQSQLRAGSVSIVAPGDRRQMFATAPVLEMRTVKFGGPAVRSILASLGLRESATWQGGNCPTASFMALERGTTDLSVRGMRQASSMFYAILIRAFASPTEMTARSEPDVVEALRLLDENFADPDVNVAWLARRLERHRSWLSRRFSQVVGLSPSDYLINRRMQWAMRELRLSSRSAASIARDAGFANPDHFYRMFKRKTGRTVNAFREDD